MSEVNFIIYAIFFGKKLLDTGVVNDASEQVHIHLPDHNLFLECEFYHVKRICEEEGFTIKTREIAMETKELWTLTIRNNILFPNTSKKG